MLPSPCDDKGSATSPQCQDGVLRDEPVARGMGAELVEHLVEAASRLDASQANVGEPRLKKAGEALLLSLLPWVYHYIQKPLRFPNLLPLKVLLRIFSYDLQILY